MVRLAGVNTSEPPSPTMTVWVRGPSVVDVTDVTPMQLPVPQPSQQLGMAFTQADPPWGAMHRASLDFTAHCVEPFAVVRQQVTNPGEPQVDFLAHFTTSALHCFGRLPPWMAAFA